MDSAWQGSYGSDRRLTRAVRTLLVIMAGVFVVQWTAVLLVAGDFLTMFALSFSGLQWGLPWHFATFILSLLHI